MLIKGSDKSACSRNEILLHIGTYSISARAAEIIKQRLPCAGPASATSLLNARSELLEDSLVGFDCSPPFGALGSDRSPELLLDDDPAVKILMSGNADTERGSGLGHGIPYQEAVVRKGAI